MSLGLEIHTIDTTRLPELTGFDVNKLSAEEYGEYRAWKMRQFLASGSVGASCEITFVLNDTTSHLDDDVRHASFIAALALPTIESINDGHHSQENVYEGEDGIISRQIIATPNVKIALKQDLNNPLEKKYEQVPIEGAPDILAIFYRAKKSSISTTES